ncbi:hypothetical protein TRFO_06037 [Tritrichomonas foetus]|uniref:Uncharacterized protein n=1 Tax=Tritrichomonas foetus TaxID=1144522 RepID=A0A1J4K5P8_9EUKA|nr:hypothetical protein TRFO_06037 [Tritrichomonas foetus]|eukprot:OHT05052.1 hypothetical protein TRFO_06037 [Tritrichomonas foetus]
MCFFLFFHFTYSVQYCITNVPSSQCDCSTYKPINPNLFNTSYIAGEDSVDLYFCSLFNLPLTINSNNTFVKMSAHQSIRPTFNITLNLENSLPNASYDFRDITVFLNPENLQILNATDFLSLNANVTKRNNDKIILNVNNFTGYYEDYTKFASIFTRFLNITKFNPAQHTRDITLALPPINDQQHITFEYLSSANIFFDNHSITLTQTNSITFSSQNSATFDLYINGTDYLISSRSTMYAGNFIPLNIFSAFTNFTANQTHTMSLVYNGVFNPNIPPEQFMNIAQFPSLVNLEVHIQKRDIPLNFTFYQNTQLYADVDNCSILGAISVAVPGAKVSKLVANTISFEFGMLLRTPGTVGTLALDPELKLMIKKFTDLSYFSDQGNNNIVSYGGFTNNPGISHSTNLWNNTDLNFPLQLGLNGMDYFTIEGSFITGQGNKNIHISFGDNDLQDIYFQRAVAEMPYTLFCNKFSFDCNEWNIIISEVPGIEFTKKCERNHKSLQCITVEANVVKPASGTFYQHVYIGDSSVHNYYDSLFSIEANLLPQFIDNRADYFVFEVSSQTTIDLGLFNDIATVMIIGTGNPPVTLITSDNSTTKRINFLSIDGCSLTVSGVSIDANTVIVANCDTPNLNAITINANTVAIPFQVYSSMQPKKFNDLTLFDIGNMSLTFDESTLTINGLIIQNSNFDILSIYPLRAISQSVNFIIPDNVTTSIKGITLDFGNFDINNHHNVQSVNYEKNVVANFLFSQFWENITSISPQLTIGLAGTAAIFPQYPENVDISFRSFGGNLVYDGNETIIFKNEVTISHDTYLNFTKDYVMFNFTSIRAISNGSLSSNQNLTIDTISLNKDVEFSATNLAVTTLNMEAGSTYIANDLIINEVNMNFNLLSFPTLKYSKVSASGPIKLNYVNETSKSLDVTTLIGDRHNVVCGIGLDCQAQQANISILSDIENIANKYKLGCSSADINGYICLYAYLEDSPVFYTAINDSKKVKPWVIAISVIIPLLVLGAIAAIVVFILMKRRKDMNPNNNDMAADCDGVDAAPGTPRKRKIQPPIPPRKKDRPSPKRAQSFMINEENEESISHADQVKHAQTSLDINVNQNKPKQPAKPQTKTPPHSTKNSPRGSPPITQKNYPPENKQTLLPQKRPNNSSNNINGRKPQRPPPKVTIPQDDDEEYEYYYYDDDIDA